MESVFARWTAPRTLLVAVGAMLLIVMLLAATAKHTGTGATRVAEPIGGRAIDLQFADSGGGGIIVTDVHGKAQPLRIAPGQDGFVRVALRSLARDRRLTGSSADVPFRLGRLDDGRLWLRDLATDRLLYLDAYGHTNAQSFARILDAVTERIN